MSATVLPRTSAVEVNDTFTPAYLNRIDTFLRTLQHAWRNTEPYSGDDEEDADERFVLRLLETRHSCLRELVTLHPQLLRASGPRSGVSCHQRVCSLLSEMQRVIRVLVDAASDAPASPVPLVKHDFMKAFMATQPAHAAAAVLHGHRQRLTECRGDRAAELDALSRAVAVWVAAAALASLIWNIYGWSMPGQQGVVRDALVQSHLLVHLCVLRLELAEGISQLSDSPTAGPSSHRSGTPEIEQGSQPRQQQPWQQKQQQLLAQLRAADARFLETLGVALRCSSGLREVNVHVDQDRVEVSLRRGTSSEEEGLYAALSHPAVHCLLGWWLVAPGVAAGCPGASTWGLPEGLVRHVVAMADPYDLCASALHAAVQYWEDAPRAHGIVTPQRPAEAAATGPPRAVDVAGGARGAGPAAGAEMGGAVIDLVPWDELSGGAAGGSSGPREGEGLGSLPGPEPVRHALPYSRSQVYKLVAAALRFLSRDHAATDNSDVALSVAVGLLVRDLLAMPRAKAGRRLASMWGLLVPALARGRDTYETSWGWHVGQLLGELPYRWRQQRQGQRQGQGGDGPWAEGERQQRQGGGAGEGGSAGVAAGVAVTAHSAGGGDKGSGGGVQSSSGGVHGGSGSGGSSGHSGAPAQAPHEDRGGPTPIPGTSVGGEAASDSPTTTSLPSSPSSAAAAAARAPHVVACALQAGLVPALEGHIRELFCSARSDYDAWGALNRAVGFVDLALRRHGCWPAMLAHADPLQASSLLVSLGKGMRGLAVAPVGFLEGYQRAVLRLEVLALLEQLLPLAAGYDSAAGGASVGGAAEAGPSGAAAGSGGGEGDVVGWRVGLLNLRLNRGVSGAGGEGEEARAGGAAGGDGRGSGAGDSGDTPAWAAGPTWRQVEEAGGCPAPGTPPKQQQEQLTALAVTELLPTAITWPDEDPGPVLPLPLGELVPHGAYRVAWGWLRLVARQVVRLPGDPDVGVPHVESGGGSECGDGSNGGSDEGVFSKTHGSRFRREWAVFLLDTLAAAEQVQQVLSAAHGVPELRTTRRGLYSTEEVVLVRAAARELLPAALDVMEVLAVAAPREVLDAVSGYMDDGQDLYEWLPLPWEADFMEVVEEQQGRRKLAALIRALLREKQKVKGAWGELKREVEARLEREGLPLLPGPYVELGFRRCRNDACMGLEGRSEAGFELQACPACGGVAYCCEACRIDDWKAGHYEECGKASGAAG